MSSKPIITDNWQADFVAWLEPFLAAFGRAEQRRWAPLYLQGLLGPGARKSIEPMAARVCPGQTQQLHHFVAGSPWATEPLEQVLHPTADRLVGGADAVPIIDDMALPKQGKHSAGVARQWCGVAGKRANCQVLVSGVRVARLGRAQVLPDQPCGQRLAQDAGARDQGALGVRAGPPAAQGRARTGSLRGPILGRAAPPCAAHDDRVCLPAAAPSGSGSATAAHGGKNQCPHC